MSLMNVSQCPVCENKVIIPHQVSHNSVVIQLPTELGVFPFSILVQYVECVNCGLIFQNPRMDDATLYKYYEDGIYRKWLRASEDALDKDESNRTYSLLHHIERLHKERSISSVLDVGCSRGILLEHITKLIDCHTVGVEINLDWIRHTPDSAYRTLDDVLQYEESGFDLITSIHTLEHVSDPVQELKMYNRLLNKSGRLIVEVPSQESPGSPYRLAHTYVYRTYTMIQMLRDAGFQLLEYHKVPHHRFIAEKVYDKV